jgi:DNA-directed RNA polymerase specialized sigma24 family protein
MEASPQEQVTAQAGSGGNGKLSEEAFQFYRLAYGPARAGCLNQLRTEGCSEEEAEEIFAATFERVMQTVDPIARQFAVPQMVNLLKTSCHRRLIDEHRHQGILHKVPLADAGSLADEGSETPVEMAESRETVAIGREAVASLAERDRKIFIQRHQLDLGPDEILANFPGLSRRTYRKIMQRANARVLCAFEEIDSGARCRDMERNHLQRFVSNAASSEEAGVVEAHLEHCRACQQTVARMRGYLYDVASGLGIAAGASAAINGHANVLVDATGRFLNAGQAPSEATRGLRERFREQVIKLATSMPGSGGDAAAGQIVGVSSAKLIAGACVTGGGLVAAGATCLVLGVSPLAMVGLQHDRPVPRLIERKAERLAPAPTPELSQPLNPGPPAPATSSKHSSRPGSTQAGAQSPAREPVRPASESGAQTEEELGLESTGRPPRSSSAPPTGGGESSSSTPSVGSSSSVGGSSPPSSGGSGGSAPVRGGGEIGL